VKTVLYVSPRIFTHKNSTGISIGFFREIPETFFVALQSISQSFYLRHQNVQEAQKYSGWRYRPRNFKV